MASLPKRKGHHYRLPPSDNSWDLTYTYLCPPIPATSIWDKNNQTIYIWGDIDFDYYGASHLKEVTDEHVRNIHPCCMNQIVPQLMIGSCLCSNDEQYMPSWRSFDNWVIQAQYFWMDCDGGSRAQCGPIIEAEPGDEIRTQIRYDHGSGSIAVSIAIMKDDDGLNDKIIDHEKCSEIVIERPFPHAPSLFTNWTDFFERCVGAECIVQEKNVSKSCCGGDSSQDFQRIHEHTAIDAWLGHA